MFSFALCAVTCSYSAVAQDDSVVPARVGENPGDTYVEPYRSIEISAIEGGTITEILVKEGDKVSAGQPLIKLDAELIEGQLDIARAQSQNKGRITAAQAEFEQQKTRYEKLEILSKRGTSNSAELSREFAILKAYEGNLLSAQEEIKVFELQAARSLAELERRTLKSPIDGTVVKITKDVAESVTPFRSGSSSATEQSEEYLIRVVQITELKATAFFPYQSAGALKTGDMLMVEVNGLNGAEKVPAKIEYIAPIIDPATATIAVRVFIDNQNGKLTSGSPARVLLPENNAVAGPN